MQRKRLREVRFIEEVIVCGITLRRHLLPNGKRVFEEEGVRSLLLGATQEPSQADFDRFAEFTRPESRH